MNKKEIGVLVLGVGGNVSQGIIKALKKTELPVKIFGACICEFSKGLYMCDEGYLCPYANDEKFIPWVIEFCNEHKIDIIFTGVEENIIELAKNEERIRENTNAIFVSSSYEQLIIGQDKYLTCRFLDESGCNYPRYQLFDNIENAKRFGEGVGYPIIAKPRNGKSSKGIYKFNSSEEIEHSGSLDNYVLEECVGSEDSEYTIGCYVDKYGNLQGMIPMKRKLCNGTTVWAKTVDNQKIIDECTRICNAFKPRGPFNIQLRMGNNGIPVCFELNVRFSGTTSMRSNLGFMDVKAMILEYIYNEKCDDCFNYNDGEVFRFDEEFYLVSSTTDVMKQNGEIKDIGQYLLKKGASI